MTNRNSSIWSLFAFII
jgi:hypothetical protein